MEYYHILEGNSVATLLTGTAFQVLLMDRSLPDDWSYDRVMLQLLGTAGTVRKILRIDQKCSLM